jgi:magnesium-transporting ATPase (P-type)
VSSTSIQKFCSDSSVLINSLRYLGLTSNEDMKWPYLPGDYESPQWTTTTRSWLQMFFLYVTLLSNFVPLSMYVTFEAINFFFLYLIYVDVDLYDDRTDTRGLARSTNITDLGQVQYVFSDKTGTLTQNVMRFKRCSVDGMVFGAPIQRSRPGEEDVEIPPSTFHPVRQLLVGLVGEKEGSSDLQAFDGKLTFNSEMFLRVLSLCHTVVVEKDLDLPEDDAKSVGSESASAKKQKKQGEVGSIQNEKRSRTASAASLGISLEKSQDGAPAGFAYQAESPDEGALVSAASDSFGFQVVGRDASGIKLRCSHPTILSDDKVRNGLKAGHISCKRLAAESAEGISHGSSSSMSEVEKSLEDPSAQRIETWSILAVNKFDSDRKRMSILLRSPPEMGNMAILLCKGADSAMLDPTVCSGAENLVSEDGFSASQKLNSVAEDSEQNREDDEWEAAQMLGIQSHLGDFASEGLRTLVLGIRFLTDDECENWLETYKAAATSIKNRDEKLTAAAYEVERNLHIVGATAIEDKLQNGVPKTIATLEKAGIKLWVLTGDKRETAIEIGYATHVLTPKMHLTEVSDQGVDFVRAQCAMEFMRLVKAGKLPDYQRSAVDQSDDGFTWANVSFAIGKCTRSISRFFRSMSVKFLLQFAKILGADPAELEEKANIIEAEGDAEKDLLKDIVRRRNVRNRAEKIIRDFLESPEGQLQKAERKPHSPKSEASGELSLSSDDVPGVFNRAQSARSLLDKKRSEGKLNAAETRNDALFQLTAQGADSYDAPLIDEDTLSLNSFLPTSGDAVSDFDKRRRTVIERLFAVDRDVRKGKLVKHLKKEKRLEALSSPTSHHAVGPSGDGPRSLVIEGAALKHLLGDSELEEVIFSIASQCEAVIACRVSPRQKALLVKLVRHHVVPEPVTLAIGDGANDVGMIQEAHVGVGISGKEGKQAVNASDFAIAQFRFLETLVLIHGRWSFFRLSTVVMFSFYKNAVMAGCLIVFNGETLFSGTPLFDEWIIAVLNFVAGLPIMVIGLFDRCLSKDYVRSNPEVYQPTRQNELITLRVFMRWVLLTFGHVFVLYYGQIPQLTGGGGMTSAFGGLMGNADMSNPGDGEGGDLQSVGTVTFTSMIILLAYKVRQFREGLTLSTYFELISFCL